MRPRCEDCANTAALFCERHAAVFVEGGLQTQAAREKNRRERTRAKREHPTLFNLDSYSGAFRYFTDGEAP